MSLPDMPLYEYALWWLLAVAAVAIVAGLAWGLIRNAFKKGPDS